MRKALFEKWPLRALDFASKMPYIGTKGLKKNVQLLHMLDKRLDGMIDIFDFFINGNWHYENKNIYKVMETMSAEELKEFTCDCRLIEWSSYLINYTLGMGIWVLKEDQVAPEHQLKQILIKNKFRFDNIKETLKHQ